ncbi:hypothetical protein KFK09_002304 [Dendrobium nobile]|uniref:Uncharacterized protein n=1 Tax=Dendrobium nobile TaxID=94219 RepID=A0A8T3C780_DENNO|nr:hypothetical protein KFK09_002304 [Dendrobium nobile]
MKLLCLLRRGPIGSYDRSSLAAKVSHLPGLISEAHTSTSWAFVLKISHLCSLRDERHGKIIIVLEKSDLNKEINYSMRTPNRQTIFGDQPECATSPFRSVPRLVLLSTAARYR